MKNSAEIIIEIEALLEELKISLGTFNNKTSHGGKQGKADRQKLSGLTAEVFSLVEEGFFKEPRTISEIQKKLRLRGIKKPTTSLMSPLLLLLRKKILDRDEPVNGGKGPFVYFQPNK